MRLDLVRRQLVVQHVEKLSPRMIRISVGGPELAGFNSPSPDDHIKIFFPGPDGQPIGRDFTPRRYDPAAGRLDIDFALHEGGIASAWAEHARPGDTLFMGGPRGSSVVRAPGAWWLLIGDETALPSIGRRLEEFEAGTKVLTLTAVAEATERLIWSTPADLAEHWVYRADPADPAPLLEAVRKLELPAGPGFIWVAAETEVSRAIRQHLLEERHHSEAWIKTSGYWTAGSAGTGSK
ncbi:siderophore-interacting protein [Silvibacterium sp.]|uniref:siderophore-interacting protein n=1 Tax=Silvibacterium sp. TaxID=1964179 RepID=UPI0039E4C88B